MNEKLFDRILLVEDDAGHAMLAIRALREFAGDVEHVEDVASAQSLLQSTEFDLVVTDLNLPDTSGVRHVEQLSSLAEPAPVIVLTSSTLLQEAVEAMKCGAKDFIVKDFGGDFKEILGLSLVRVHSASLLEQERLRLQREMAKLRVAIENGNDALAVIDDDGLVRYSNRAFQWFAQHCGGDDSDFFSIFTHKISAHSELKDRAQQKLQEMYAGAVWDTELDFVDNKNEAYSLSVSGIDPLTADGEDHECVVWIRDISDVKRREKFQREILSTTSHDLKGPLGAIVLSTELLKEMLEKGSKPFELVLRVGSSAQGAINLIDEFLSARRIQEGTFILKPETHNVVPIVSQAMSDFQTIAEARKIDFTLDAIEDVLEISVDKIGLSRVLSNLLSNAMKFTPKNGSVSVRMEVKGDDLHIWVTDSGAGMEASEVRTIFQRFSRLEKHRDVDGTGIGLFVVKSIVAAHGGKIEVSSRVGEGTSFEIILPKKPPVNERGELISLDFE